METKSVEMPRRIWIVRIPQFGADRPDAPQSRLETCDEMTYGSIEYVPASDLGKARELLRDSKYYAEKFKEGCIKYGFASDAEEAEQYIADITAFLEGK
jgi:hypothetical protein